MAKIKNPMTVVSASGGSVIVSKIITQNGTYNAPGDNADGYNPVTVNVPQSQTLFKSLVDRTITSVSATDLSGVTVIGSRVFYGCSSLLGVDFPPSITTLQASAFFGCANLREAIFVSNLVKIEASVFNNCNSLKKVVIPNSTPPTLDNSTAFTNNALIYVPTPDTYRVATNWSAIASRIFPLVSTVADLANIDTTTYTKACVIGADESYKEYTYDGTQWNEVTA